MNARAVLVVVLAAVTLLPAVPWHRPHVPDVPTHVIGDKRVAHCQHLSAGWDPSNSDPSLRAWAHCMNLRRQP